jgi:hypothetical protein
VAKRGICGNVVEGFARRRYENVFKNALNNSLGEVARGGGRVWQGLRRIETLGCTRWLSGGDEDI